MEKEYKGYFYGTTKEDEEKKFKKIHDLAVSEVSAMRSKIGNMQADLHELREVYDPDEKEGLSQWFNMDARFAEVRKELLRAERMVKKPYFGRIDIVDDESGKRETYYIGKTVLGDNSTEPEVIDWRAPVSSVYYDHSLGECTYKVPAVGYFKVDLQRKRTYEIDDNRLVDYYDSDVVANDDLLTKYLSKSKRNVLSEIIATIQDEQNKIIRRNPKHNMLVQGSAGSGKTTVAMHRISYILYNYELEFKPDDFYIIGSNKVLLDYITGVLPDLDVYGVRQMTMAELFARLLYEDWGVNRYRIKQLPKNAREVAVKAGRNWFENLERFAGEIEAGIIPDEDIVIPKNGNVILSTGDIQKVISDLKDKPMIQKLERLNDLLMSGLETELYGRYYSYNNEEQKKLTAHFKNYFNRFFYKKSVFELYEQFVAGMRVQYPEVPYIQGEPDLYDLASLAYLYKRIKETQVIQEASHVVIDEAQDFGIMAYISLKYCMSKCTFTIMGDVAQNINFGTGLGDWEELKAVMLPDKYDYFGLLKKSYRNTVEISKFATDILRHGTFPIYPVEPIVRHGEKVDIARAGSREGLNRLIADKVYRFKQSGYETIAVICKDAGEAKEAYSQLKEIRFRNEKIEDIRLFADDGSESNENDDEIQHHNEFGKGVLVLPLEYSKGLEFDAVIVYDANEEAYPYEDSFAKLLYVAVTRALHELSVFYTGELTGLIKEPIPEDRVNISFSEDDFHQDPFEFEEEFKTRETIAKEQAENGDVVMRDRDTFGPRRIEKVLAEKEQAEKKRSVVTPGFGQQIGKYKNRLVREINGHGSSFDTKRKNAGLKDIASLSEYGSMPDGTSIQPLGHGKIDVSIKWVIKDKKYIEAVSGYGTLRITPVSEETARISFYKNDKINFGKVPEEIKPTGSFKYSVRESKETVELVLPKLKVSVNKRNGLLSFFNSQGSLLLTEKADCPRQYHGREDMWWQYLDFGKKENISSRGEGDKWDTLDNSARYISHGDQKKAAVMMSSAGYQLVVAEGIKTLLCTIPAYGPYISFEGAGGIDYFIRSAR